MCIYVDCNALVEYTYQEYIYMATHYGRQINNSPSVARLAKAALGDPASSMPLAGLHASELQGLLESFLLERETPRPQRDVEA